MTIPDAPSSYAQHDATAAAVADSYYYYTPSSILSSASGSIQMMSPENLSAVVDDSIPRIPIFANKFAVDDRVPQLSFHVPHVGTFGLTSFDPTFWLQSFFLVFIQTLFNVCVALFVYRYIICNKKKDGTTTSESAFFIGYGFIIPLLLFIPWLGIKILDLQNIAQILLVAGATPSLLILRCAEAMHGTLPPLAYGDEEEDKVDRYNFVLYYATTLGFQFGFDPKTHRIIKTSRRELVTKIVKFARLFAFSIACYSVLIPLEYKLFPYRHPIKSFLDSLYWGNLLNNLVMAATLIVCLDTGSTGLGIAASLLTGYSTTEMNDKPLIASQTPSEFWGRRWNRIFAGCLKSGVYLPARRGGFSRCASAMLTFVVSGLLHEYVLLIMAFAARSHTPTTTGVGRTYYYPNFGNQLLFFTFNGLVMMMEGLMKDHPIAKWMNANLARPIKTTLVMMTALPILHWFTDEYVACGMFADVSLGFPKVVYLGESA